MLYFSRHGKLELRSYFLHYSAPAVAQFNKKKVKNPHGANACPIGAPVSGGRETTRDLL